MTLIFACYIHVSKGKASAFLIDFCLYLQNSHLTFHFYLWLTFFLLLLKLIDFITITFALEVRTSLLCFLKHGKNKENFKFYFSQNWDFFHWIQLKSNWFRSTYTASYKSWMKTIYCAHDFLLELYFAQNFKSIELEFSLKIR